MTKPPNTQPLLTLDTFFPYRLRRTYAAMNKCLASVYEDQHGLSQAEWRVLAIIARDGQIRSRDIAIGATIDKVAVSRAVSRLEKKKLVERKPNKEDARSILLTLSHSGETLYNLLSSELLEVEAQFLKGFDKSEITQLINMLMQIENNASADT